MEKLLVQCIDAVKKEIYRRRLKSRGKGKDGQAWATHHHYQTIYQGDDYGRIRLRDFSDIDKRRVLHELLSNEQVFTHLYDLIYGSVSNNTGETRVPEARSGRENQRFFLPRDSSKSLTNG